MIGWAIVLIVSMAGIVVILLRRLPDALRETRGATAPVSQAATRDKQMPETGKLGKIKKGAETVKSPAAPPTAEPKLNDLETDVLIERGEAAFAARNFSTAREIYEILLTRRADPKWYNRLGAVNMELERFREARDAFRGALRFGSVASRHANLGLAEYALGHRVTAISHLRKAIALAPHVRKYQELLEQIESSG